MTRKQIQEGDKIPDFELKNQDGELVRSDDLIGRPFVLYFYPKDDTPGCTAEACSFRDAYQDFRDLGAEVVGVSADDPASHRQFADRHRLPYLLLSDEDNHLRNAFGIPGNFFGLLPGRVTFIIDDEGIVRYSFNSQFNVLAHVAKAKSFLKASVERLVD